MFAAKRPGRMGYRECVAAGIAGLMVLGAAAVPAAAAQVPQVSVPYGDLDLSTREGAEQLYARIEHAARQVCPLPDSSDVVRYVATAQCRHQAVARAVSSISSPQLAAVYTARNHHAPQSAA